MDPNKLLLIAEYGMNSDESQAFKIGLLWEEITRHLFPHFKGLAKFPEEGDPRRSSLFKWSWKFMRETRGIIRPDEYRHYMRANLEFIKHHKGNISPNVLCGDKAWVRWKVWKRLYDAKMAERNGEIPFEPDPTICNKLDTTKRFLFEKCEGEPTIEKMQKYFDDKVLNLWIMTGKVSHFYLVLSPFVASICPVAFLERDLAFDAKVYENKITDDVRTYFKREFPHEFA